MKQQGVALLLVLVLLATLAGLAAVATERGFFNFQLSLMDKQRQQARWYAISAESMAGALLLADSRDDPGNTHLSQRWATLPATLPVDEVDIQVHLSDGRACLNLNGLRDDTSLAVFVRLLEGQGVAPGDARQISDGLADWLDSDDIPRDAGAEDGDYLSLDPPRLTARQPMQSLSELRLVRGVSQALWHKLAPLVCVLPGNGQQININTLSRSQLPLISALAPEARPEQLAQWLAARPLTGWSSVAEAIKSMEALTEVRRYLAVDSEWFVLGVSVTTAEGRFNQRSLLHRAPGQVTVAQRQYKEDQ